MKDYSLCGDLAHGPVEGLQAAMNGRSYYISAELGNGKHLTLSNDPDEY